MGCEAGNVDANSDGREHLLKESTTARYWPKTLKARSGRLRTHSIAHEQGRGSGLRMLGDE